MTEAKDGSERLVHKIKQDELENKVNAAIDNIVSRINEKGALGLIGKTKGSLEDFKNTLRSFKTDQFLLEAEQIFAKEEVESLHNRYFGQHDDKKTSLKNKTLDQTVNDPSLGAKDKKTVNYLILFAWVGIGGIVALITLAGICAASDSCGLDDNIPLLIIQSQFMMVFVGAVVAPIVIRLLKEKYDIDIEASQVSMIYSDAVKAVNLYQKEANKLRNKDGKIPKEYQEKLRDLAFDSMKTNYDPQKYASLISSVGAQVFEKSIESAVKNNWIQRYPVEKKQVEELIKQSIDAYPQMVEWQKLSPEIKESFLDGHVKRLLSTLKLEGWATKQLELIFDAEANKRMLAGNLLTDNDAFRSLHDSENEYLKYTSTVLAAAHDSLFKK